MTGSCSHISTGLSSPRDQKKREGRGAHGQNLQERIAPRSVLRVAKKAAAEGPPHPPPGY
jgi:hypothetical protein